MKKEYFVDGLDIHCSMELGRVFQSERLKLGFRAMVSYDGGVARMSFCTAWCWQRVMRTVHKRELRHSILFGSRRRMFTDLGFLLVGVCV
jgi:hypothetical protein